MFKRIIRSLKKIWFVYDRTTRSKLTDAAEYEVGELEHIFALITLGSFVGLPAPPMQIMLDLLPEMEDELILLSNKVDTASAPLSDLASVFEVG